MRETLWEWHCGRTLWERRYEKVLVRKTLWARLREKDVVRKTLWKDVVGNTLWKVVVRKKLWERRCENDVLRKTLWERHWEKEVLGKTLWEKRYEKHVVRKTLWERRWKKYVVRKTMRKTLWKVVVRKTNNITLYFQSTDVSDNEYILCKVWGFASLMPMFFSSADHTISNNFWMFTGDRRPLSSSICWLLWYPLGHGYDGVHTAAETVASSARGCGEGDSGEHWYHRKGKER